MAFKYNDIKPTTIKYNGTNLTVLKYGVREGDLSGEATRASVSSYSKAALDSYVGLVNDTWGGITNTSSLSRDKYYYIRVLVTDTNRYGKFCIRFKTAESPYSQTITVDNMGWGYDGEVLAAIPVWGKPYTAYITKHEHITGYLIQRTDSPNQHAPAKIINNTDTVYHGDVISIAAIPESHYKVHISTSNVWAGDLTGEEGRAFSANVAVDNISAYDISRGYFGIGISTYYVPYMHELWTGSYSCQAKNQKVTVNWPVALPSGVTSVSINVNFSFRGKNVSGTYTVNNSGTNASAFIKYSGVSKTTMTISWKNNSQFYFESTGNSYYATATISSISCVY
jgi:hypothetical protein